MSETRLEEKGNPDKMEILKEQGIVSFNVELTSQEEESIEKIKIEKALPQFNYYGPVNEDLIPELASHLNQLEGNAKGIIDTISSIIAKTAEGMQKDFNKDAAWVMVRVTMPDNEFDSPRWHTDGTYFKSDEKTYKLVFTIKGTPTRFAEKTDPEKFNQLIEQDNNDDVQTRKELEETVQETESINKNQATIYLVGDEGAKVHSEPPTHQPRIFMSVIPGSTEQIEELRKRWEKK